MDKCVKEYSVGLIFSYSKDKLLLIRKSHPEWQKGLLNGIGGKIEPNETALEAVIREVSEEAYLITSADGWKLVLVLHFPLATIHFYAFLLSDSYFQLPLYTRIDSPTDESIEVVDLFDFQLRNDVVHNIRFIIPLAIDRLKF